MPVIQWGPISLTRRPVCVNETVGAACPFQDDIWPLLLMPGKEAPVDLPALFLHNTGYHLYACLPHPLNAFPCNLRVGVSGTDD